MPPPPPNPLHLYRALLRECTYLPDPIARTSIREQVTSSFRAAPLRLQKGVDQTIGETARQDPESHHVKASRILRAQRDLRTLQQATSGYEKSLLKTMHTAYGLTGKRRHTLLAPLLTPRDGSTTCSTEYNIGEHRKVNAKLDALISSYLVFSADHTTRPTIKLKSIPTANVWGRPLPQKRVKNLQDKRWARILDGLCPPLEDQEWDLLRSLASGDHPWEGPPRRRPRPRSQVHTDEPPSLTPHLLTHGPIKGNTYARHRHEKPHNLSKRYMRRVWRELLAKCCHMTWDAGKQKWLVQWGFMEQGVQKKGEDYIHTTRLRRNDALFQDVNARGKVQTNSQDS